MFRLILSVALCCISFSTSFPQNFQTKVVNLDVIPFGNNTREKLFQNELKNRIINGVEAPNTPWIGRIITKMEEYQVEADCGGSLIAPHWALTARHCIVDENNNMLSKTFWISLGHVDWINGEYVAVKQIIYSTTSTPDIALLRLERDVTDIQPIPVQLDDNIDYNGRLATVYGWGKTENQDASNVLKMANVVLYGRDDCPRGNICLNPEITHTNVCGGDSGGPMVIEENGRLVQIGIARAVYNVGSGFCNGDMAFFTSTAYYGDFIRNQIQN